jgi:HNH endonuclease
MQANNDPVPNATRQFVINRANFLCEYCLPDDRMSFIGFEVDHIISRKHRGTNNADNLAYSYPDCNRNKGTDIASIDWNTNQIVRFYNPRIDPWDDHFVFDGARINSLTPIGEATVYIFKFNDPIRLMSRSRF